MKNFSAVIIGAGGRGSTYAAIMKTMPEKFSVVGVAEPIEMRRNSIKEKFSLSDDVCFSDWHELLSRPKMADIAVIATMDNEHYEPAMKAISLGYNLLLEKPVAQTAKECTDIANAAKKAGVCVLVCHVLRYSPFYKTVKSIVRSGMIGEVMSVIQVEAVGDRHNSHSYIRGDWRSEKESTPMLLAKSCHDLDIIQWLIDKPCKKVQSFGELTYFKEENAPKGAPVRCADGGCPVGDTCPYNCFKIYCEPGGWGKSWGVKAITRGIAKNEEPTDEEIIEALKTTDFGLCVFHAH
ncbi:MAG: Gfo/Idh/MocA family protein, partial [Eubacteriales bacterium]